MAECIISPYFCGAHENIYTFHIWVFSVVLLSSIAHSDECQKKKGFLNGENLVQTQDMNDIIKLNVFKLVPGTAPPPALHVLRSFPLSLSSAEAW